MAVPAGLRSLLDVIDWLGRFAGISAALALATLTLLILGEIVVRLLATYIPALPAGIPAAWEVSTYLMGYAFMAGSAMALRAGAHIRVGVLLNQVPAPGRRLLEIVTTAIALLLTTFLAYSLIWFSWSAFKYGQTSISSDIPTWIPKAAIAFGATVLALQVLGRLISAVLGLPLEDERLKGETIGE
ncbi:MAG: TRAP transporter small permease subunit [Hyphomicrobiaceae bacterium]